MIDYLLFRLYGPLASWGEIAVGESRHSAVHPSRSALLGLLGAALGIERNDDSAHRVLAESYRFGIKLECTGTPLRDYHTVDTVAVQRKARYRTRRQELADSARVSTMLSMREYRCDSLALIALEALENAPYDLERLAEAMRRPRFHLYLGRKSCPLALPLAPRKVSAATLREALDATPQGSLLAMQGRDPQRAWPTPEDRYALRPGPTRYYWEDGMQPGMDASFQSVRHDQPLSRRRWQFATRREWVFLDKGEQS